MAELAVSAPSSSFNIDRWMLQNDRDRRVQVYNRLMSQRSVKSSVLIWCAAEGAGAMYWPHCALKAAFDAGLVQHLLSAIPHG